MNYPLMKWNPCKRGIEKGKFCTSCYAGFGLIYDGKTFKIDKCLFCS